MTMINKIFYICVYIYCRPNSNFLTTAVFPISFISYIPVLILVSFHVGEFVSCYTKRGTNNQLLVEIQSISRLSSL